MTMTIEQHQTQARIQGQQLAALVLETPWWRLISTWGTMKKLAGRVWAHQQFARVMGGSETRVV